MRLKSLELQGFKSFPDKTILNFDSGITVVVGPNGSGKSNISDAVRWVLGELSSKSIRGTKMEDVIFGGTDIRRPMSFAEVSLTIDNTDSDNRMSIDYDEVTVTRRYYRGGESDYLINRSPVRLKDIAELFMNTGIGRTGYNIIGQGKVAEILSQKSDERRIIFEEAAGISKYRHKKQEAERKLADAEDNLTRISDILNELGSRVEPLKKESEKARKYLEFYDEKKKADISLWLFDISNVKNRANALEENWEIARHELEMADDTIAGMEKRGDGLYEAAQKIKLRLEQLARSVRELTENKFKLEGSERVLENEIVHIKASIIQLEDDRRENNDACADAEEKLGLLEAELSEKQKQRKATAERREEVMQKIASYAAEIDSVSDGIYEAEKELSQADEELVKKKLELSSLEGSRSSRDERIKALEGEINDITLSLENTEKQISDSDKTTEGYGENIRREKEERDRISRELSEIREKAEELQKRKTAVFAEKSALVQRADALRRMEEQLEGYAGSVRFVMNNANDIGGIIAPVSKLITVSEENTVAVETALGANIQNIVTEDERSAKAAIAALKKAGAGRTTFYPLTSVRPQPLEDAALVRRQRGFVGLASELVKFDKKYEPVISYLLGRTAVFDDIENASAAAGALSYRVRLVTLDGQQINAGGSYTGGSVRRDSGMLTRAADIKKLDAKIGQADKELSETDRLLSELSDKTASLEKENDEVNERVSLFSSLSSAEETQRKVLEAKIESENERLSALKESNRLLFSMLEEYSAEKSRLENDISIKSAALEAVRRDLSEKTARRASLTAEQSSLGGTNNEYMITIATADRDIEAIEKSIAEKRIEITLRKNDSVRLLSEEEEAKKKLTAAEEKIGRDKETTSALEDELSAIGNEQTELTEKSLECERQNAELREQIKDKTRHREKLFVEFTKLEAGRDQILSEQDKLTERLWEEYELTYTTASELNYPPVTEETRKAAAAKQSEYRNKLRALGTVNVGSIEEYAEVTERFNFLSAQFEDLTKAKAELGDVIFRLEGEMRVKFVSVFQAINENFKTVFRELFGGGKAELALSDPDNVLTSGIEINVAPPGKIIKSLSLLSGGEQAFVAIALFFSILKVNPTPFCLLDEIESALDEVNISRFCEYVRRFSSKTQFIIVSHRRGTMENADTLYGVTMHERGISKVLSVNINEVEKKLGVKL